MFIILFLQMGSAGATSLRSDERWMVVPSPNPGSSANSFSGGSANENEPSHTLIEIYGERGEG
jgi:hypothetical protein